LKKTFLLLPVLVSSLIFSPTVKKDIGDAGTKIHATKIIAEQKSITLFAGDSVPLFNKIVVVIGENMRASSVIGNTKNAPYINSIIQDGACFTQSYSMKHPSQPNYLMLFSGSDQNVVDNDKPLKHFTTPNLASELIKAGKSFINYSEDMLMPGFDGTVSGLYVRKHNPVANWMGNGKNQVPPSLNQPFTAFPFVFSSLPDVSFVIPNLCNDGHNYCLPYNNPVIQFDTWIKINLDAYRRWCVDNKSLLIITYDEDDYTENNRILTVFYGYRIKKDKYSRQINTLNILRTIEDGMGLTNHAGQAARAKPITFCWSPAH